MQFKRFDVGQNNQNFTIPPKPDKKAQASQPGDTMAAWLDSQIALPMM
jgi:hypothetical protein